MMNVIARTILALVGSVLIFAQIAGAHELRISQSAALMNGPELQPGEYRVDVEKNQDKVEVRFYQRGELAATVPANLTPDQEKSRFTEVHTDQVDGRNVITKIRLQGSRESIVFNAGSPKS